MSRRTYGNIVKVHWVVPNWRERWLWHLGHYPFPRHGTDIRIWSICDSAHFVATRCGILGDYITLRWRRSRSSRPDCGCGMREWKRWWYPEISKVLSEFGAYFFDGATAFRCRFGQRIKRNRAIFDDMLRSGSAILPGVRNWGGLGWHSVRRCRSTVHIMPWSPSMCVHTSARTWSRRWEVGDLSRTWGKRSSSSRLSCERMGRGIVITRWVFLSSN